MPQRRRYATRAELAALFAERTAMTPGLVDDVLEQLAGEGVPVDHLVKIEVAEGI